MFFLEGYGCKRAECPRVCKCAHGAVGPLREADGCVVDCKAGDLLAREEVCLSGNCNQLKIQRGEKLER